MNSSRYDCVVIGCGPGGSSASTFLARAGKRVITLEKEVFPRFHIGESLLPCNQTIFREMGVLPELEKAGFPRKHGAQFVLGNGAIGTRFVFRDGLFNREPETFQVERAKLDHILLKHARASGADVREGWTVQKYTEEPGGVTVQAADPEGKVHTFQADYLIDSSGRGNLTGNQAGLRVPHPKWRKLAVFGHFKNVRLDPGEARGDTVIIRLENKWFWIIPVSHEKTSVGLVIDKEEYQNQGLPMEKAFAKWVAHSPVATERMANAELVGEWRTTTDFSYFNSRLVGERVLRVGDAAGFMDPIFSAGVYLAMWSGKLAAETTIAAIKAGRPGGRRFAVYEKRVRSGVHFYWRVVENYYTTPFMELFLQPHDHFDLPSAVIAVLAGELEGRWALRWRLEYFFILVKLQARWALVPHLDMGPARVASKPPATTPVA